MGLASSTTASSNVSMVCHQRAFSLPSASPMLNTNNYQNTNLNFINNNNHHIAQSSSIGSNSPMTTGKCFAIQPIHQRTRSLPLTEENAIKLSQSPPQSFNLVPSTSQKLNNNSMESIIEDYQSSDTCNNNHHHVNSGASSNSILKHLTSPSQLRKKRHHHNVITAPLRSTYFFNLKKKNNNTTTSPPLNH